MFSDEAYVCKKSNDGCNSCLNNFETKIKNDPAIRNTITNNVKMAVDDFIALGENPNLEKITFRHEFHKVTLENNFPLSN